MKNHIAIKFIAILLCTLSLLGCVGSAVGLYAMTEADLYNKTIDQFREDLIWENGESFAHEAALIYASQALGGCPEGLVENHYAYRTMNFLRSGRYSYAITDADGKEVYRQGDPISGGTNYAFPVTGQYLHLVSQETTQDRNLREARERAAFYGMDTAATVDGVEIPGEGLSISYASFTTMEGNLLLELYYDGGETTVVYYGNDGSVVSYNTGAQVGYLMVNQAGNLVFRSDADIAELDNVSIREACFFAPGDVSLRLEDSYTGEAVGYLYNNDQGSVCFMSQTKVTVSDSQAEPLPEAPEQLTIDPTPGLMEISSTIPQEGSSIALFAFYGTDGTKLLEQSDPNGLGYLYFNQEGGVTFVPSRLSLLHSGLSGLTEGNDVPIAGVFFQDASGEFTYRATGIDGVGSVSGTSNRPIWKSKTNILAPITNVSETFPTLAAEETVPQTQAEEDAGETKAETAPEETSAEETAAETKAPSQEEKATEEAAEKKQRSTEETAARETSPEAETAAPAAEATLEPTAAPTEEPTVPQETMVSFTIPEETAAPAATIATEPMPTEPVIINGKPLDEYQPETESYYDSTLNQWVYASFVRLPMPEYTVVLQLAPDALRYEDAYTLLGMLRDYRKALLPTLAVCLLLFAVSVVYLCTAAGKKPKCDEIHAGGLNRMPLDLYFALAFGGIAGAIAVSAELIQFQMDGNFLFCCAVIAGLTFAACLLFVAFGFALIAQVKTPGGYWYRNTLCGQCLRIVAKFARWLEHFLADKGFPFLARTLKFLWKLCITVLVGTYRFLKRNVSRAAHWVGRTANRFFSLLPITWQWLLAGCVIIFIAALTLNSYHAAVVILGLLAIVGIILYGAHCFGVLSESARNMSKGDLNTKVSDKMLFGCFKDFAHDLNDLADVAVVAAQKQLRSERMKTELITNVSHDIKTPLTSIINYVDLLQKPHTPEDEAQYLEVLDRQSLRLKKLIEDLMEMSKASTGNMTVEITKVDAVESVNQALGEFSDKLAAARLTPVFRHTEDRIPMLADGKLVWRVLSNLLGNAVKYAMPGTRLYIDLMELEGKIILSLKNISREELNLDADELMERFVRGDDSRNTEGSGLGLNIAKSLMELQKGQLQLLVDGDLFKVTLIFPGA